jgi:hypothetical protein
MWGDMKRSAMLITCLSLFVAPSAALGQGSSTCQSYNVQLSQACGPPGSSVFQVTAPPPPTPPATPSATLMTTARPSTNLPFTGFELGLLAAGGLVLLAAGLVVRRLSARPTK